MCYAIFQGTIIAVAYGINRRKDKKKVRADWISTRTGHLFSNYPYFSQGQFLHLTGLQPSKQ